MSDPALMNIGPLKTHWFICSNVMLKRGLKMTMYGYARVSTNGQDLNPIEQAFSKLKAHLRKAAETTVPGLLRRIGRLLATFSPQECRNFLRHAGYVQT
jgi:transposase